MRDLNDLYYFVQVVDHGGFAAAGRALAVPKSKLSRRIAQLEAQLGVRLIQRSTRRFTVTEIGQEYHRHCVAMLVQADAAQEVVARTLSGPQGTLRLSCPTALLDYQVGDMLARYQVACPGVHLQVLSSNRRLDVIGEGLDLAIRVRFPPLQDAGLVMKVLGQSTQRLVASPSLVRSTAAVRTPPDLSSFPSLDDVSPNRQHAWDSLNAQGTAVTVPHEPRLITDDRLVLRIAALRGVGIAQLPTMMVRDDLIDGRLVDVLPDWRPRPGLVHAVFPSRRGLLPAVRRLIDFLAEGFDELAHTERADEAVAAAPRAG